MTTSACEASPPRWSPPAYCSTGSYAEECVLARWRELTTCRQLRVNVALVLTHEMLMLEPWGWSCGLMGDDVWDQRTMARMCVWNGAHAHTHTLFIVPGHPQADLRWALSRFAPVHKHILSQWLLGLYAHPTSEGKLFKRKRLVKPKWYFIAVLNLYFVTALQNLSCSCKSLSAICKVLISNFNHNHTHNKSTLHHICSCSLWWCCHPQPSNRLDVVIHMQHICAVIG